MTEIKIAFVGFGNVARAFARMVEARRGQLAAQYNLTWRTTAIATRRRGCVVARDDLDMIAAVECAESDGSLLSLPNASAVKSAVEMIEACDADVLFETTPLEPESGAQAIDHIRRALSRRISVVTANKGPLAFAYSKLSGLASARGVSFRFEGAVMDGAPVFNLVEHCLPAANVIGFSGVLNSTTNLILGGMEKGRAFADCLAEAQTLGIAEANADFDIDGWDAAVKAVALANVLMGADARPVDVKRTGIRGIGPGQLADAAGAGNAIRLVARAERASSTLALSVRPESVPLGSPLGCAGGTSNVLILQTDLMRELAVIETEPRVEQTAYALLSDWLRIHLDEKDGEHRRGAPQA